MAGFTPTAFKAEQKGERMVAIYATVDGEEVFVGSSLNGGGFDAAEKVKWIVDALEAHYGLKAGGKKSAAKKAPAKAPAKKAPSTKGVQSLLPGKKVLKKASK